MSNIRQWITKADFILILLLFFAGIVLTLCVFLPQSGEGGVLEVRQNGKLLMTLPLNHATEQTIPWGDGQENHFVIRDGTVTMTSSDCPDQTCIRTGGIRQAGQSIVCLPHRLVLTIKEKTSSHSPLDAVVQ